jgi:hypothetical protein
MNFKQYLTEAASEERLTHLEHAEDHIIHYGEDGFTHAFHNLNDVHEQLSDKKNKTTIMTKYDGSPSVVFGHHPETGKFFVTTKSAWNKNPKLNFSEKDIEANHGHQPGLVQKLKTALQHLPKVTPKKGIFQGDLMHSGVKSSSNPRGDIVSHGGKYHFTPNTITYSTSHGSDEGKNIEKSKVGIVVHTAYHGNKFENLKPDYAPDLSHFGKHQDVHMIDNRNDVEGAKMSTEQSMNFRHHMGAATNFFKDKNTSKAFKHIQGHEDHLSTFINKSIRDSKAPSVEDYMEHVKSRHLKDISKVKTQKSIDQKTATMNDQLSHIEKNKASFTHVLNMHKHLQGAKDELVHALSAKPKYEHTINGTSSKPEGYVVVRNNRPTKLVDRQEFSRANFLARET